MPQDIKLLSHLQLREPVLVAGHEVHEDHPRPLDDHADLKPQGWFHLPEKVLQGPTGISLNIELEPKKRTLPKPRITVVQERLISTAGANVLKLFTIVSYDFSN